MGVVKYIGAVVIVMLMSIAKTYAQSDPTLTGMILMYTNKAEKQLKNQEQVMLMMTTGHIWTKEEVKATTDLHREFNNYLDSFRSIVCYAAQVYGFYHEVTQLTNNMGGLIKQLDAHPSNGLAVALSTKRNKIYRELILNSVEIVNDIFYRFLLFYKLFDLISAYCHNRHLRHHVSSGLFPSSFCSIHDFLFVGFLWL